MINSVDIIVRLVFVWCYSAIWFPKFTFSMNSAFWKNVSIHSRKYRRMKDYWKQTKGQLLIDALMDGFIDQLMDGFIDQLIRRSKSASREHPFGVVFRTVNSFQFQFYSSQNWPCLLHTTSRTPAASNCPPHLLGARHRDSGRVGTSRDE